MITLEGTDGQPVIVERIQLDDPAFNAIDGALQLLERIEERRGVFSEEKPFKLDERGGGLESWSADATVNPFYRASRLDINLACIEHHTVRNDGK